MNESRLAERVRELEARVHALEALEAARDEIPPMPEAPRRYREAAWFLVVFLLVPAQRFEWPRVAAWAERLCVRLMTRGVRVAAQRGTAAQRAHAARVYGGGCV